MLVQLRFALCPLMRDVFVFASFSLRAEAISRPVAEKNKRDNEAKLRRHLVTSGQTFPTFSHLNFTAAAAVRLNPPQLLINFSPTVGSLGPASSEAHTSNEAPRVHM